MAGDDAELNRRVTDLEREKRSLSEVLVPLVTKVELMAQSLTTMQKTLEETNNLRNEVSHLNHKLDIKLLEFDKRVSTNEDAVGGISKIKWAIVLALVGIATTAIFGGRM